MLAEARERIRWRRPQDDSQVARMGGLGGVRQATYPCDPLLPVLFEDSWDRDSRSMAGFQKG